MVAIEALVVGEVPVNTDNCPELSCEPAVIVTVGPVPAPAPAATVGKLPKDARCIDPVSVTLHVEVLLQRSAACADPAKNTAIAAKRNLFNARLHMIKNCRTVKRAW